MGFVVVVVVVCVLVFGGGGSVFCVCAYVHEEAAFSGGHVLPLGSIYTPFSNTYKFTNFSNEQVDSKPSPVWQYCVLPAEKRGFYLKLNAKSRGHLCTLRCR